MRREEPFGDPESDFSRIPTVLTIELHSICESAVDPSSGRMPRLLISSVIFNKFWPLYGCETSRSVPCPEFGRAVTDIVVLQEAVAGRHSESVLGGIREVSGRELELP